MKTVVLKTTARTTTTAITISGNILETTRRRTKKKNFLWRVKVTKRRLFFFLQDPVANAIVEFKYNPDEVVTFATYYRRYEEIFKKQTV